VTDRDRLSDWVKSHPVFAGELAEFAPMAGGQSSTLFRFTCTDGPASYVIRMEPRGRQIFLAPDIVQEFRIAQGLSDAGLPTAPSIAVEPSGKVLGAPFMVMGEVQGVAPLGRPSMHVAGLLTELDVAERARLSTAAIDALVAVHAVEWRRTHNFLSGSLDQHLDHLDRWYHWTVKGREFPVTNAALAYLKTGRAGLQDSDNVLLWGDARPGNILFASDQSVAAILDWEAALIGPRGLDLGYWLMMDRFHADAIGIERLKGWPSESETIARYAAVSGTEVANLDYFIVMGAFFMATTMIRAADMGIATGRFAADSRFGFDNSATQILADLLGLSMPSLSPDFTKHRGLAEGCSGLYHSF
jgi:aminoglycoside phosphotransferase (APT) family kinase protein